jgi:hypothetical protein
VAQHWRDAGTTWQHAQQRQHTTGNACVLTYKANCPYVSLTYTYCAPQQADVLQLQLGAASPPADKAGRHQQQANAFN